MTRFSLADIFVASSQQPSLHYLSVVRSPNMGPSGETLYKVVRNPPSGYEVSPDLNAEAAMGFLISLMDGNEFIKEEKTKNNTFDIQITERHR